MKAIKTTSVKTYGTIIFFIGLAATVFAGFNFITREKVVEIGSFNMMANNHHTLDWSPYLGVSIMAIGFVIYLSGKRRK